MAGAGSPATRSEINPLVDSVLPATRYMPRGAAERPRPGQGVRDSLPPRAPGLTPRGGGGAPPPGGVGGVPPPPPPIFGVLPDFPLPSCLIICQACRWGEAPAHEVGSFADGTSGVNDRAQPGDSSDRSRTIRGSGSRCPEAPRPSLKACTCIGA